LHCDRSCVGDISWISYALSPHIRSAPLHRLAILGLSTRESRLR
jgi:hypothetical protein